MKRILIASLAILPLAVGCGSSGKGKNKSNTPTITESPAPAAPVHQQPMQTTAVTPVSYPTDATPVYADPAPSSGQKYTVKKGDTLWSIAQRTYGDGKQYRKIISANPSIKGERVLVGQTITLP